MGVLRVKKEGNIASGYFVIFITHRVRVLRRELVHFSRVLRVL